MVFTGLANPRWRNRSGTDRQAFVRLQEQSREGIKPHADGTRPLNDLIKNLTNDHTVTFHLLPTPAPVKIPNKQQQWDNDKWGKRQVWKQGKYQPSGSGSKGYEKNGGKLPQALKGCASSTPSGKRSCFATSAAATSANQERPVIVANTFARSRIVMATIAKQIAPRGAPKIPTLRRTLHAREFKAAGQQLSATRHTPRISTTFASS